MSIHNNFQDWLTYVIDDCHIHDRDAWGMVLGVQAIRIDHWLDRTKIVYPPTRVIYNIISLLQDRYLHKPEVKKALCAWKTVSVAHGFDIDFVSHLLDEAKISLSTLSNELQIKLIEDFRKEITKVRLEKENKQ